jgi:hypothetical protein
LWQTKPLSKIPLIVQMLREQFDSGQGTNNLIAVDHFIAVINLSAGSPSQRG